MNNEQLSIQKIRAIQEIVDSNIKNFVEGFELRYTADVDNPIGVVNQKKNNIFMAELGQEFMFYSAFVRSFDSSFGNVLENMGNAIAKLTYEVRGKIKSYLLPQQTQHIDYLLSEYERGGVPKIDDYKDFNPFQPQNIDNYEKKHETDNYFYNPDTNEHIIIELKAGGDLDNKKARSEKISLLHQYFLLKNKLIGTDDTVRIYLATAYNKFGEGNNWKQERVQQYFASEELLIGKDYWNFVCNDEHGFDIVFEQYKISSKYIKEALIRIKNLYINESN